jgi:uncharacterized YccA/Bax inhibitor family protein
LLLAALTAAFAWNPALTDTGELASGARLYLRGGLIGGFVLAMATVFKKRWAPVSAPLHALLEGLFPGTIPALYVARFDGIVSRRCC